MRAGLKPVPLIFRLVCWASKLCLGSRLLQKALLRKMFLLHLLKVLQGSCQLIIFEDLRFLFAAFYSKPFKTNPFWTAKNLDPKVNSLFSTNFFLPSQSFLGTRMCCKSIYLFGITNFWFAHRPVKIIICSSKHLSPPGKHGKPPKKTKRQNYDAFGVTATRWRFGSIAAILFSHFGVKIITG